MSGARPRTVRSAGSTSEAGSVLSMEDLRRLRALEKRYRKAAERAERLRAERNAGIREAVENGERQSEIARELELTRGRIAQILSGNQ